MTDAERSAITPSATVLHLDQQVMAYLAGKVDLDEVVALCVATLGSRPKLSITLAYAGEGTHGRLRALEEALART